MTAVPTGGRSPWPAPLLTAALMAVVLSGGCPSPSGPYRPAEGKRPNILLISIDTLRADRLGCYGFGRARTPVIDGLAGTGIRFERCLSQTPLTLPSHTTLLSSTYPAFHGVRDNGGFLVPQELETLPEVLKGEGYDTAAAVGAYVLDSKWGLNQGFDFYYDRFEIDRKEGFSAADVQRPAEEVVDHALEWLKTPRDGPFFLFVHLYDPHTPYDPPSPYAARFRDDLYSGEVAYVDSQVGRLLDALREAGLSESTVIVFTADHGESLGEHGESTHGFFVYQAGIHVPLILSLPGGPKGGTVPSVVSLVDVMPTILELAGAPLPSAVQGRSLVPLISGERRGGGPGFALSETFYPRFHYGWNEVQCIQDERYKLILSPGEELYDVLADPGETEDLSRKNPAAARRLARALGDILAMAGRNRIQADFKKVDEAARERLASLGYVGTFVSTGSQSRRDLPSPRDKINVFNRISQGKELSLKGDLPGAERVMLEVVRAEPEVVDAYFVLGNICFKQKKYEDAVRWLGQALERKPDYDFVALNMAIAFIEMEDLGRAEGILVDFVGRYPADALLFLTLGDIHIRRGDYPRAISRLEECLRLNPTSAAAHISLARVYLILDRLDLAQASAWKARELNPEAKNLGYTLGQIYQAQGRLADAESEYLAELERHPENFNASFNLALLYRNKGNVPAEETFLLRTKNGDPSFPLSYIFLGEMYYQQGGRDQEAIELLSKGVSLSPDAQHLKLAYYLLAKAHLRRGDQARASEYARKIELLERTP